MKPIIIALLLCTLLTSCNKVSSTQQPSPAFKAFDLSQVLTEGGFHLDGFSDSSTTNPATGIAKQIRSGTFTAPASTFPCYKLFQLVKKHFDAASQGASGQEGWIPKTEEHPTEPVHIAMRYNQNGRHGELHLWLFPSENETKIGFALYLLEEPLR